MHICKWMNHKHIYMYMYAYADVYYDLVIVLHKVWKRNLNFGKTALFLQDSALFKLSFLFQKKSIYKNLTITDFIGNLLWLWRIG